MSSATPTGKLLLVVEDDDVAREGMTVLLQREGYRVVAVATGQEALDRLRAGPAFDLILLDILLPGLDGWQVLERLREAGPSPSVLVVTAVTILGREWALSHGAAGLVPKPVQLDILLSEVRRCLEATPPTAT